MVALKRVWLVIFVLLGPAILVYLLDMLALALLAATNRVVDPFYLELASAFLFAFVTFVVFLEAKSRW